MTGFSQKRETEKLERALERLVALRANGDHFDQELAAYIDRLPDRIRRRLVKLRLLDDPDDVGRTRRLSDILGTGGRNAEPGQFEAYLLAKGDTPKHARQQTDRARRVLIDLCRFVVTQDIDEAHVLRALARLSEDGLSVTTRNAFRQACRSVTRWLFREGRLRRDPLAQLDKAKGDSDGGRRALTADEQRRLVETTREQPVRGCISGEARSVMYLLALTTGLRRGELLALRRRDLVLEDDNPAVTVAHGHAKNRRNTRIPLQPEVAAVLRGFLRDALPASPVFRGAGRHYRAAEVLDHDLDAAGIPRETEVGRCDFHSLRVSFVTSLARAGVSLPHAQKLARHCSPTLTSNIYSKFAPDEDAAAIARLPRLTSEVG